MLSVRAMIWVAAAFSAVSLPFVVLLSVEREGVDDFAWNFSKGLGFGALAMAGLQFALTARFRPMTRPFGIDIVYVFHRYLALGALGLMLGHFGILWLRYEEALGELNPLEARWELTVGRLALVCFVALVATSELRKRLGLPYGSWRWLHLVLGVGGFGAAIAHVLGVGEFTATTQSRALWLGVTAGWAGILAWTRLVAPAIQRANPWRVVTVEEERGGAVSLTFEPDRRGLPLWKPGQFAWLTLGSSPFGLGEHPFTIASSPERAPAVTMTVKPLGGFSKKLARVRPGARAFLHGPYGTFSIDNEAGAEGFAMIAGGIGITPMIANLRSMRERGDRRPVVLVYANPDWQSVAFREELAELEQALDLTVVHVLERAPEGWEGENGMVSRELLARHLPKNTRSWPHFLCGPPPMVEAVKTHLSSLGVALRHVDSEIFDMV